MNTLSRQAKFDAVYDSMVNGQRRQAIQQATDFGLDDVPAMLEYFSCDLNQPEMAISFAKAYFSIVSR